MKGNGRHPGRPSPRDVRAAPLSGCAVMSKESVWCAAVRAWLLSGLARVHTVAILPADADVPAVGSGRRAAVMLLVFAAVVGSACGCPPAGHAPSATPASSAHASASPDS